jgi:NTE family protein
MSPRDPSAGDGPEKRIAIVLPGGGARGAYEVGALSVLLPELERRGEKATVFCGTSVGAINAAFLGSVAHLPAEEQVRQGLKHWHAISKKDIIRSVVGPGLPRTLFRLVGDMLEVPGVRLAGLMDPTPLRATLDKIVDWDDLAKNGRDGAYDAVCLVATSLARSGPVAWVQGRAETPASKRGADLKYVRVDELDAQHVRASAAIPLLFAPVRVDHPGDEAPEYYVDGATRLNTPIAPALALGADRVIVIGFEPLGSRAPREAGKPLIPRIADVISNIVDGLLVDQVNDDLHQMVTLNEMIAAPRSPAARASRKFRSARGAPAYRKIEYALVSPRRRGELGELADEVYDRRYRGWRGLRSPDLPLFSRLLGNGRTPARGELLSFLLFDDLYFDLLIEAGKRDAHDWLDRHPDFWCSEAGHDFDFDTGRIPPEDTTNRRRRSTDVQEPDEPTTGPEDRRRRSTDAQDPVEPEERPKGRRRRSADAQDPGSADASVPSATGASSSRG